MKHVDHYKAKVSQMTQTDNEKVHQMDANMNRKPPAKFRKDKSNVSTWNQNPQHQIRGWSSQALKHEQEYTVSS